MSFQIWIKTDKPLPKLATEIRDILSLPPFKQETLTGEPYYQFEMLGMLIFLHVAEEEEDRDPEIMGYPYRFDMQTSFVDHELDTDAMVIRCRRSQHDVAVHVRFCRLLWSSTG